MTHQVHLAVQYLAAAGISFLEKEQDESHTNLQFIAENGSLHSRPVNEAGHTLSFNYHEFSLGWNANGSSTRIKLDGTTHVQVLKWIQKAILESEIEAPYKYTLPYELPYKISDDFTFNLSNQMLLNQSMHLRILAQDVLEVFIKDRELKSEIRVWPHHLNTGAFALLGNGSDFSISLGLAIPNTVCDEYYFYLIGYKGNHVLSTKGNPNLRIGEWYNSEFNGAILPATGINVYTAFMFYEEALDALVHNRI